MTWFIIEIYIFLGIVLHERVSHLQVSQALRSLPPSSPDSGSNSVCEISSGQVTFYIGQRISPEHDFRWLNPYTGQPMNQKNQVQSYRPVDLQDECAYVWGNNSFEAMACNSR